MKSLFLLAGLSLHSFCSSSTLHGSMCVYVLSVQAVFDDYEEGDVVWCQDYHLMLLPALLKARYPKMKVSRVPGAGGLGGGRRVLQC